MRSGEEVGAIDQGEGVAKLRQPSKSLTEIPYPGLMKLVQQGKARLGPPHRADLYPRLPALLPEDELTQLIAEERADR